MSRLRRMPVRRLIALCGAAVAALACGTAVALAALGNGGAKPPAKPLASAVHDALAAPQVSGLRARIRFTNKLISSSSLEGSDPLITGASGRLWLAADGRARLELQSDQGDANIVTDGKQVTVYDGPSNTVYSAVLPKEKHATEAHHGQVPSLARIQTAIADLMRRADISGAEPSNVAGRPAYTVRISPKPGTGGLIGAGKVAWDAATGAPLRAGIYAAGTTAPVLELTATQIQYGPIAAADLVPSRPKGAKVVNVDLPAGAGHGSGRESAARLPFKLSAPAELVGLRRHAIRTPGKDVAVISYGEDLGGIVVIERPATGKPLAPASKRSGHHDHPGARLTLPTVPIGAASGQELATALGTFVRFEHGGVEYTVVGSVPRGVAEAAAKGL